MALITVKTRQEFEDAVLKNDKVTLVDFWAAWCPPCRAMEPSLENIAKSMDAEVDVVKVNVEDSPDNAALATEYGVQGIPNMQIFKSGNKVDELVGLRPEPVLRKELQEHL